MNSCTARIVTKHLLTHLSMGFHAAQKHHGLGEQAQKQELGRRNCGLFVAIQSHLLRERTVKCMEGQLASPIAQGLVIQRGGRCDLCNRTMLCVNGYSSTSFLSCLDQETAGNSQAAAVEMQFGLSGQTRCQEPN